MILYTLSKLDSIEYKCQDNFIAHYIEAPNNLTEENNEEYDLCF